MATEPDPDTVRIGTAERDEASQLLGEHFAAGRLSTQELEQRMSHVVEAWTRGDMRPLFDDLPAPHPAFLAPCTHRPPHPPLSYPYSPPGSVPAPQPVEPERSRILAGVLQIVLPFGTGRFYSGETKIAVAQLVCALITFGIGSLWPFIDGIVLLIRGIEDSSGRNRDH